MKSFVTFILAIVLACVQQVWAQSATGTGSAPAATPTQPAFINTPGLQVDSPLNSVIIPQSSYLTVAASIEGRKPIATAFITIAKKDGSGNVTIADIKGKSVLRVMERWNTTSLAVGDYFLNINITPDNTIPTQTPSSGSTTTPSSAAPTTVAPPPTSGSAAYYWQGVVRIAAPAINPPGPRSAATSVMTRGSGAAFQMAMALGAIVLGCVLML